MKKVGILNGFDVFLLNETDFRGFPLYFYNNKKHTREQLIRMLPYDKNGKISF